VKADFCYWTVADADYALMAQSAVMSARRVGVTEDFHIWTDRRLEGATCHESGCFDKSYYHFKLELLPEVVRALPYTYFVWFDADTYFVRHPGDVCRFLFGSPIHVSLESDLCQPNLTRSDWWGCSVDNFTSLMRNAGIRSRAIFEMNAGLFIIHRDVVDTLLDLTWSFRDLSRKEGYSFTEEPLLAYAMQMLCANPFRHTLWETASLWASDWTGCYYNCLPNGAAWTFVDYFTDAPFELNPAIVHAMRSKAALIEDGKKWANKPDD
jgi:hypothetical protein